MELKLTRGRDTVMTYDDLVYMVRTDMNLGEDISLRDIQIAYSKAKNIVVSEQERGI